VDNNEKLGRLALQLLSPADVEALRQAQAQTVEADVDFYTFVAGMVAIALPELTIDGQTAHGVIVKRLAIVLRGFVAQYRARQHGTKPLLVMPCPGVDPELMARMSAHLAERAEQRGRSPTSDNQSSIEPMPGQNGAVILTPLHTTEELLYLGPFTQLLQYAIRGLAHSPRLRQIYVAKMLAIAKANLKPGEQLPPIATLEKAAERSIEAIMYLASSGGVFGGIHYPIAADNSIGMEFKSTPAGEKMHTLAQSSAVHKEN
jgi:hypothetical protein